MQHGWSTTTGLSDKPRLVRWLPKLVWSSENVANAAAQGIRTEAIGAPFLYLDLDAARAVRPQPGSAISYPKHGWARAGAFGSHDKLATAIAEREHGPVTVCLYHLEYREDRIRRPYEARGFRVITHGDRASPTFLIDQLEELSRHERVVTNNISSALWYGGMLGREIEVYGPVFGLGDRAFVEHWRRFQHERWPDLTNGSVRGDAAIALAAAELGATHVRGPAELRELLGWNRPTIARAIQVAAARTQHHARRALVQARNRTIPHRLPPPPWERA